MTNSTATTEKPTESIDDPLGDIERTGNCDHCGNTGTTDTGQPCYCCIDYGGVA